MKDFIFRNDTKLFFRNDIRETVSEVSKGHKVMFVYGSGSVKRNGCYDDIVRTLSENGIPFVEYGGSSREFEKIEQGIRIAKTNGVTMIIGAGGASVMDSAKLIACGFDSSIEESVRQLIELFSSLGVDMYYDGEITREQVDSIPCSTELGKEEVFGLVNALMRR